MLTLAPTDHGYPALLGPTRAAPTLFVRGELLESDSLAIAIVGSRRPSPYGVEIAEQLAGDLAARGITIVSGLARGIDTAAHRGALEAGGRTIAVLAHGLDRCYPPENRSLADRIEGAGAVVSQFMVGARAERWHFPERNRTIAGLALGVVVVEAAERSGALITAGAAGDLGREVYAVPGRVTTETSRGPHGLLRDGATLVRSWMDVVQEIPLPWRNAVRDALSFDRAAVKSPDASLVTPDAAGVLALIPTDEPRHIEDVIVQSGLSTARIAATLLGLELGGHVRQLEGQRWIAIGARARKA